MITISLREIADKARRRPAGYYEEVVSRGVIKGDEIEFTDEAFGELRRKYRATKTQSLPPEPTALELAANFTRAMARWSAAGFPVVSEDGYHARSQTCEGVEPELRCAHWDGAANLGLGKCKAPGCGCTRFKRWLATEKCPLDKWPKPQPKLNQQ